MLMSLVATSTSSLLGSQGKVVPASKQQVSTLLKGYMRHEHSKDRQIRIPATSGDKIPTYLPTLFLHHLPGAQA